MREDKKTSAGIEAFRISEILADNVVGEMAGARHDALFDVPGVGADFEHFEIVIRFQNEAIALAEVVLDELGQVAEIGHNGELRAIRAESIADWIGGIVRDRERRDFDFTDGEAFARANVLHAIDSLSGVAGERANDFAVRQLGQVGSRLPMPEELREAASMIRVFVRDEDAVEAFRLDTQGAQAAQSLLATEAGVNQEARMLGFEQSGIARTARRENGDSQ